MEVATPRSIENSPFDGPMIMQNMCDCVPSISSAKGSVFYSVASLNLNTHIKHTRVKAPHLLLLLRTLARLNRSTILALPSNIAIESGSPVTVAGSSGDFGKQHHL
jgi:hypothetical protein